MTHKKVRSHGSAATLLSFSLFAFGLLTGCGVGPVTQMSVGTLAVKGIVHGGQQPVTGSTIKLYTVGKTGNGSAATSMLSQSVTTDSTGSFALTGLYTCASSEDQVYIAATGGNPGLGGSQNNGALIMLDALGRCGDLGASSYITINEITTAAFAYALAPFIVSVDHVGASATNALGIKNAFLNAKLLADPATGLAPAALASNLTTESGKLYALANSIAPCVNSDGTTGCNPLFTATKPSTGISSIDKKPTDTLAAVLNVVRYPANNVSDVFNCASSQPPFPSTLTAAPNDWTMSLTVTGGGLHSPTAIGIDVQGNVWTAGYYGVVNAFSPQGTPFSSTGYGIGSLNEVYGMTIDNNNNIWATNQESPYHNGTRGSLVRINGVTSGSLGTTAINPATNNALFYDNSVNYPNALSTDSNGNVLISNYANSTGSIYTNQGVLVSSGLGSGNAAFPVSIAADLNHGVWLANQGDSTVTHVSSTGTLLARPNCCNGANGVALDSLGNAWISNYYGGNVSEVTNAGVVITLPDDGQGGGQGGLDGGYPSGIAIDAAQNVWVADYRGTAFTALAGNLNAQPAGTGLSPLTGYGLDAGLLLPFGIAVDPSGNVWISNYAKDNIVMFFGLAAPTATPKAAYPVAP